ncbi:hypothetical protein MKW92_008335 [Papaver armeniacum]|nr:hypothetical protein MKW92_008335 [Papaver armeniacum]
MVSTDTVVGIIGSLISSGLFLSHIPTFYSIYKKRDAVEDFSPSPCLLAFISRALWVYYGTVHPNNLLVVTINGIGLVIEFSYLALYLIYASKKQRVKKSISGFVYYLVAMLLVINLLPKSRRDTAVGMQCVLANNVLMWEVPCDVLLRVRRTKNLECMSFWLSLFGFLNSGYWLIYGLLRHDVYIVTCNVVNCVLGVVQLCVYAYYYFNYSEWKSNKVKAA